MIDIGERVIYRGRELLVVGRRQQNPYISEVLLHGCATWVPATEVIPCEE